MTNLTWQIKDGKLILEADLSVIQNISKLKDTNRGSKVVASTDKWINLTDPYSDLSLNMALVVPKHVLKDGYIKEEKATKTKAKSTKTKKETEVKELTLEDRLVMLEQTNAQILRMLESLQ